MERGAGVTRIVLSARSGQKSIDGELLAEVSSEAWPRWITFGVYSLDEGGYAVHRVGRSVVYHRLDTPCATVKGAQSGRETPARFLPEGAVPCKTCQPLPKERLAEMPDVKIRLEVDRPVLALFGDAAGAQDFVVTVRDRLTGQPGVFISDPVRELLHKLREIDPAWAALPWPDSTTDNPEGTVKQKNRAAG